MTTSETRDIMTNASPTPYRERGPGDGRAAASLSLRNLVKCYTTEPVVKGINLTIESGEMLSLLGPSGCGKTTTLRMIAGLEAVTEGTISLGDRVISGDGVQVPPERRNMGMVFQTYALWPHKSVARNVSYALERKRLPKERIRAEVQNVLALVGLGHLADRYPSELSGGQQQRVALARAIAHRPSVLLFDEPLSNLDTILRDSMRYEIRQLQQQVGTTGVYVTHSQDEALALSDKIAIMNDGSIIQYGRPEEVYDRPATAFTATFMGRANLLSFTDAVRTGDRVHGRLETGEVIAAEGRVSEFGDRSQGSIAVRPENVLVSPMRSDSEGKEFRLTGTVETATFSGGIIDYSVRSGDLLIHARGTPPFRVRAGDEAVVSFDANDVVLLDD